MRVRNYVIIFLVIFFAGCAYTTVSSIKDPDFTGKKYSKIMVVAIFSDLQTKQITEKEFVDNFKFIGVNAVSSIDIISPLKKYNKEEIKNIIRKNKIDGVLIVALKNYWETYSYVPETKTTAGSFSIYGNNLYYKANIQKYGGFYTINPNAKFESRLFDVETEKTAWLSVSTTKGNAFTSAKELIGSLATSVVSKLRKDNMI